MGTHEAEAVADAMGACKRHRERGNGLVGKQDFTAALEAYQSALDVAARVKWSADPACGEDAIAVCEQRQLTVSNALLALQRLDRHDSVASAGSQLLALSPKSARPLPVELETKIRFRLAASFRSLGRTAAAVETLTVASALNNGENESVEKALGQLRAEGAA